MNYAYINFKWLTWSTLNKSYLRKTLNIKSMTKIITQNLLHVFKSCFNKCEYAWQFYILTDGNVSTVLEQQWKLVNCSTILRNVKTIGFFIYKLFIELRKESWLTLCL